MTRWGHLVVKGEVVVEYCFVVVLEVVDRVVVGMRVYLVLPKAAREEAGPLGKEIQTTLKVVVNWLVM